MHRSYVLLLALVLLAVSNPVLASTGPLPPTFLVKWGAPGTAPGFFDKAPAMDIHPDGSVFAVDFFNHRIQKFDARGNFLTTWGSLGTGDGQFTGPFGVAVNRSGDVYVADTFIDRIQKFDSDGNFILKWGSSGTLPGEFDFPVNITTDRAGNVYVVDQNNDRIQKFDADGNFILEWSGFSVPYDIASDPSGDVYVVDVGFQQVRRFDSDGAFISQWGAPGAGDGEFNGPLGVAVDAAGGVYVTDTDNNRIQKFDGDGTFITKWGSAGAGNGQFDRPRGIAVNRAGDVYVGEYDGDRVQVFSGSGVPLGDLPPSYLLKWGSTGSGDGQFNLPVDVAAGPGGDVYVVDSNNNRIQKFDAGGTFLTKWGTGGGGDGQFSVPLGVGTDASADVYVAEAGNHRIQKFSSAGVFISKWGTFGTADGQVDGPRGIATDAAGDVYVVDSGNDRIQKFSSTGTFLTKWGTLGSADGQFDNPSGVATDGAGFVYVADADNDRIQKFDADGNFILKWGSVGSGDGQFNTPWRIAADAHGDVYVTDQFNERVQKFTGHGVFLAKWGSNGTGNGQFDRPRGIAVGPTGAVFVAEQFGNRVQNFLNLPHVMQVLDVENDQGRNVQIRFERTSGDAPGSGASITGYEIYRRIDLLPGAARAVPVDVPDGAIPVSPQLAGWTYLMSAPAHGETEYNVVAPTLVDAIPASLEYSAFLVRATTGDPFTFHDSQVVNGFSVDNLPPPAPTPFTGAYVAGGTNLHWGVSSAFDFEKFRLYRGTSESFTPGPGNLIATTADTGHVDAGPAGRYYKLSAVDINGNEGAHSLVGPAQTVAVVPGPPPVALALEGVRPNPATGGRLTVHFALPSTVPAVLELMDVMGRRLAVHQVGSLGVGRHAVDLNRGRRLEPGIYLVRLTQGTDVRVRRVAVLD